MSIKHSKASKARWAKIPKEERSQKMSIVAKKLWATKTPEDRKQRGQMLAKARKNIKNLGL